MYLKYEKNVDKGHFVLLFENTYLNFFLNIFDLSLKIFFTYSVLYCTYLLNSIL